MGMARRVLVVNTYYPEFLRDFYAARPGLDHRSYAEQLQALFAEAFGVGDAYSHGLTLAGAEAAEIICNADALQARWAVEHGLGSLDANIHDRRRQIVAAQITDYRPDVLLVFEWCPLGDGFLADMKSRVPLIVGQIASPLPANRTFRAYDLMLSSYRPIVDFFRAAGQRAEPLKLAFDERIPARLELWAPKSPAQQVQQCVTFVGGFAANHGERIAWLERILEEVPVEIYGYGLEQTRPDSPIRRHHGGPVWGLAMYDVLRRSAITLNYHARIDVPGIDAPSVANNMRLYEATGMGTCLFTEAKPNLGELFAPDQEVVTFRDAEECVEHLRHYLSNEPGRRRVAEAGRRRTRRDHTYAIRMKELLAILKNTPTRGS